MIDVLAESLVSVDRRGDCVERVRPDKAYEALRLLSEGMGINAVRERTGLSNTVVTRLSQDHRMALNVEREKMAYRLAGDAEKARKLLRARMDWMDPDLAEDEEDRDDRWKRLAGEDLQKLATTMGITTDKAERLADRATIRVEVKDGPGLDEVRAMMEELRESRQARGRVVEAEGIEDSGND